MLNDNDIELVETGDRGAVPVFDGVEHRFPRGRLREERVHGSIYRMIISI